MMLVIAIPDDDGRSQRALAGMQEYKKLGFPVGDGTRFAQSKVDFVYITNPSGKCEYHGMASTDVLRQIADHDIGGNAPQLADELRELADRIEKDMSRDS